MVSDSAKKLKVEVNSEIRAGFRERGWIAVRGRPGTYSAPSSLIAPPIALIMRVTIDPDKYGGVDFTGRASVVSDVVTDVVVELDRESIPSALTQFPGDELIRQGLSLAVTTAGGLLDPGGNYYQWVVRALDEVSVKTAEFFAMVDGPLAAWASGFDTPEKLFAEVSDRELPTQLRSSIGIRAVTVLALLLGRPEVARAAVSAYAPDSVEDKTRFPAFERELASRFPDYGLPQQT